MFSRLFGPSQGSKGGAKAAPVDLNNSIQQLRGAVNQLEKRETHLEKKIDACVASARAKSKKRDKKGAIMELKKKKQLENQLNSIQGKKLNLETQIMTLEDAHLNTETLKAMKTSAQAMKQTVKEADLDKAEDLMDDIQEAMDQVQEMNEAMSNPLMGGDIYNEDDLLAELDELEAEDADQLLMAAPDPPLVQSNANGSLVSDLPTVPNGQIRSKPQVEDDEDAELAKLEMDMT